MGSPLFYAVPASGTKTEQNRDRNNTAAVLRCFRRSSFPAGKEVRMSEDFMAFLISAGAGIVAGFICRWLDRDRN